MSPAKIHRHSSAYSFTQIGLIAAAVALIPSHNGQAATYTHANGSTNLDLPAAWVGGTVPGASDIALYDSNNSGTLGRFASIGGDTTWGQVQVLNPASSNNAISITNSAALTSALTLNGISDGTNLVGLDMSGASATFSIFQFGTAVKLGSSQTWKLARTLLIGATAGAISGIDTNGFDLTTSGAGTLNMGTLASPTIISGSGGVTLGNTATTFFGANTYTGATHVNSGATLTLSNTGALQASALDVTGAGTIALGVSGTSTYIVGGLKNNAGTGALGTTLAAGVNSITLNSTAQSAVTIASFSDFQSGAAIGLTTTGGTFTLDGTLTLTLNLGAFLPGSYSFNIFDITGGTESANSTFAVTLDGNYSGSLTNGNSYTQTIGNDTFTFDTTTGNLNVTAVPEPSQVSLVIAAGISLMVFRWFVCARRRA